MPRYQTKTALFIFLLAMPAFASSFKVIHKFPGQGFDGKNPTGLIVDKAGNLYGATYQGGSTACTNGCGLVYELSPASGGWTYKVLYGFKGQKSSDGSDPNGLVMDSAGNLYGTTLTGGANNLGTVFELSPNTSGTWTENVLYSFGTQSGDGNSPKATVVMDTTGNLYGTTEYGGNGNSDCNYQGCGTVFKLSPSPPPGGQWTETIIWSFKGIPDGAYPVSSVTLDPLGNIFGTNTDGVVYELSPEGSAWIETTLATGLEEPQSPLAFDTHGNLYGTTFGGTDGNFGIVFEISPVGGNWNFTTIWTFNPQIGDGAYPSAGISVRPDGSLYGATQAGGYGFFDLNDCYELYFCGEGTVFRMTQNSQGVWAETSQVRLHGAEFEGPAATLVFDSAGNLYGTAYNGTPYGEVFEITP